MNDEWAAHSAARMDQTRLTITAPSSLNSRLQPTPIRFLLLKKEKKTIWWWCNFLRVSDCARPRRWSSATSGCIFSCLHTEEEEEWDDVCHGICIEVRWDCTRERRILFTFCIEEEDGNLRNGRLVSGVHSSTARGEGKKENGAARGAKERKKKWNYQKGRKTRSRRTGEGPESELRWLNWARVIQLKSSSSRRRRIEKKLRHARSQRMNTRRRRRREKSGKRRMETCCATVGALQCRSAPNSKDDHISAQVRLLLTPTTTRLGGNIEIIILWRRRRGGRKGNAALAGLFPRPSPVLPGSNEQLKTFISLLKSKSKWGQRSRVCVWRIVWTAERK